MPEKPEFLILRKTSNLAKSFMNSRTTTYGDKTVNRGQWGWWQHLCHAGVLQDNRGIKWVTDFLDDQYDINKGRCTHYYIYRSDIRCCEKRH